VSPSAKNVGEFFSMVDGYFYQKCGVLNAAQALFAEFQLSNFQKEKKKSKHLYRTPLLQHLSHFLRGFDATIRK
jgi:hypothetical protein